MPPKYSRQELKEFKKEQESKEKYKDGSKRNKRKKKNLEKWK
jgi:hypothetical protein